MDSDRSLSAVPILIAGLIGLVVGAGLMYVVVGPKSARVTASPPMAGGRPAVAPLAALPRTGEDIVQRPDGMVFIHSGAGAVTAMPTTRGGWSVSFGYRPAPGGPVDPKQWESLVRLRQDRRLQQELNLTPDQLDRLQHVGGPVPCPAEDRAAVQQLFQAYVAAAPGGDQDAPKKALLERVRQTGEAQGPLAAKWLADRLAVLNDEQRAQLNAKVEE